MLRWNGFGRSLIFAAAAAAGLPVAVVFAGPAIGAGLTVKLYMLTAAGCYASGLGDRPGPRRAAWALAAAAGLLAASLPLGLTGTAVCATALIAVCRGGLQRQALPLRAVVIELALGAAALGAAAFLASGGLRGLALAVWGYFLVQSAAFLIGGRRAGGPQPAEDPFERARARLERLALDTAGAPRP